MSSLSTKISTIDLPSCFMNAAGCYCLTHDQINELVHSHSGAIVTKSGTLKPKEGNILPRLYINQYGSLNSMGLPNYGYKYYMNSLCPKPYIQSLYPFNLQELEIMLTDLNKQGSQRLVEINLSCPNVQTNHRFNSYSQYFDKITQLNCSNLIVGVKLAPLFESNDYDIVANLLLKSEIKFITCCNSLPGSLMVDYQTQRTVIAPQNGLGGLAGFYIKPISLSNVYNFNRLLKDKIDIIGCGGITTGRDIFEYILCGAKAVQVGTQLIREGPQCFNRLETELYDLMRSKNYTSINDFCGNIIVCDAKL